MKTFVIILLCLLAFTTLRAQTDRVSGWSRDIDHLSSKIREQHYVYRNKELPSALIRRANDLRSRILDYSDERMLIELQSLIYHLGDGHSYILPIAARVTESKILPLHMYQFSDGMYVIDADQANEKWIGMRVRSIAGVSTDKIMKDMVGFVSQDNPVGALWIGPTFMRTRGLLERYGLAKGADSVPIVFEGGDGRRQSVNIAFMPPRQMQGIPKMVPVKNTPTDKMPLYLSDVSNNYWFKYLPQHRTVYVQFNQVRNKADEDLTAFSARLGAQLAETKTGLLIVDVRHNNGGNSYLFPPLIKALKDFEQIAKGKLVVITGRNTFSAAQNFISQLDRQTNAIFVGERSSSKPNFVGEENELILPYSGAIGSISNRYHENIPGDRRPWIEPDLTIRLSSRDYFSNRDPVMDAVLRKYAK